MPTATYSPWLSSIAPAFWSDLTAHKLNVIKLADASVPVVGRYTAGKRVVDRKSGQTLALPAYLELGEHSFNVACPEDGLHVPGTAIIFNTIEQFGAADKKKILREHLSQSSSLNTFVILVYADLKKYKYMYWVGHPAYVQKPPWDLVKIQENIPAEFTGFELSKGFMAARKSADGVTLHDVSTFQPGDTLVFVDPSGEASQLPWLTRNVLYYLSDAKGIRKLDFVSLRDTHEHSSCGILELGGFEKATGVVGWERNARNELAPKTADLAPMMDPTMLASEAMQLNLKLMRWRLMPELDLEAIADNRALLLGAGTLGCYVARTLLAWGTKKITLVDSSTVSFSNPVRQPLFDFEDSLEGGKPKAAAAADALKRIYPGVDAQGVQMSIPMPGHPVSGNDAVQTTNDISQLTDLIDSHDTVFLLMDSRESRWLPTMLCSAKNKLAITVALGFDTFVVMRHGLRQDPADGIPHLGCYYCNDIVAPTDSSKDRTFDQMCTVTRPGLAGIASALAVELLSTILQHPRKFLAPSDAAGSSADYQDNHASCLGNVPHQIRGFLGQFNFVKVTGHAYNQCTACSSAVIEEYAKGGEAFLRDVFQDASVLERVTGLDKLVPDESALMEALSISDDEDDF